LIFILTRLDDGEILNCVKYEKKLGINIGRNRKGYENFAGKRKVRLNVWMERSRYVELKELAHYEDKTVSDIVRELIDKLLLVDTIED